MNAPVIAQSTAAAEQMMMPKSAPVRVAAAVISHPPKKARPGSHAIFGRIAYSGAAMPIVTRRCE